MAFLALYGGGSTGISNGQAEKTPARECRPLDQLFRHMAPRSTGSKGPKGHAGGF